ncbi:MAG: beta-lactamase family protein [Saprospiraceae bacterium]|nr:beta-lactamase family protein [Saprospiraceae bacterium]
MRYLYSILIVIFGFSVAHAQWDVKIDSIFLEFKDSPGCAVGVFKDGEIIFKKGYGIANLDYDIPITPTTVFDIGSVSKQFTAACIVILENKGKLSFDDDIRKFIPEIPEYAEGIVTIRHLLHHTSGLRDYLTLMYLSGLSFDDYFTEEDGLSILTRQKELNFQPGSEYLYSNSGYLALAIIVRRISGMSIGEFTSKHIFEPLGMKNSLVYEDGSAVIKNRAIGYAKNGEEFIREHHFDFVLGGDGQVYTTVEDFFKWNENFKSNQLGNETFMEKLLTRGVLLNGDTLDYALGIGHRNYRGHSAIGHGGAWGGFRADYMNFQEQDLAIVVMSNLGSANPGQKVSQVAGLFLEDKSESMAPESKLDVARKATIKEIPIDQMVGKYGIQAGMMATVSVNNDSLTVLQSWDNVSFNIIRIEGNTFQVPGNESLDLTFSDLKDGHTQLLTVIQNGVEIASKRVQEMEIQEVELKDYEGDYFSEELDVTYDLSVKDEILMVHIPGIGHVELAVYAPDQFLYQGNLIKFDRKNGAVSGFSLDAGRVTNLKFSKVLK